MASQVFVGRAHELAELQARLERARTGAGSWVSVLGEAGIGKTRLVAELTGPARVAGDRVLSGRCSSVDGDTPFRPVAEALMTGLRDVDPPGPEANLGPYLPAIARFVPRWRDQQDPLLSESVAVLGESLLQVLTWLAGDGAMLLVLEDLHWVDPATRALCEYLNDHVGETPVLIVATARTGDGDPALSRLLGREGGLHLLPFSPEEVTELATAWLGTAPDASLAQRLVRSGGLPLLVEDLLTDPTRSGRSGRYGMLVGERFSVVTPAARRAAAAAALVGERFTWELLDAAVGGPDLSVALHELTSAQLVVADRDGFAFRHALVRDLVLQAAATEAAELRASVALALENTGEDEALSRAADLWAAAGDRMRAARLLQRAASGASQRGAPRTAQEFLSRAGVLADGSPLRAEVDLTRLQLLVGHGHPAEALELGARLLDTADQGGRSDLVRRLRARALLDAGRPDEARAELEAADATARHTAGVTADVLVLRARIALGSAGEDRRGAAEHLAHEAVAIAQHAGDPALACEALELVARCARSRSLADAEAALKRALELAEQHDLTGWRLRALNELGTVEMLRAADGARLHRARAEALRVGALDVAVGIEVNIASLHAMRGEVRELREAAERAEAGARRLGLWPLVAAAMVIGSFEDAFEGRRDAMVKRLAAARELAPHDADLESFAWGAVRGLGALLREERQDAVAAMQRAAAHSAPVGSLDPARGPLLLVLAAGGHATSQDLESARAAATPGAGWSDLWLGYGEAALAGAAGDASTANDYFIAADPAARRHPLFRAIGLRLLAEAALRDGWGEPVSWLQDAEATFVAGGQDRIAGACRTLLKQAGAPTARRRGADRSLTPELLRHGVTAREAEVLELVAERLGNKDIAARLYLSPRTVEKHVASLLMKLELPDRAALVARGR